MIGFTTGNGVSQFENTNDSKSILELYSEYDFIVVKTLFKNKYKFWNWTMILLNIPCVLLLCVFTFLMFDVYISENHIPKTGVLTITGITFCIVIFNLMRKSDINKKRNSLNGLYYVQNPRLPNNKSRKYCFCVNSDRKWGLIKLKDFKIVIPTIYDEMSWREDNKTILAYKTGKAVILDTNNQICI